MLYARFGHTLYSTSQPFPPQIVPGSDNTVAIELIATHVRRKIEDRSRYLRTSLARIGPREMSPGDIKDQHFPNLTILPQTPQLQVSQYDHSKEVRFADD